MTLKKLMIWFWSTLAIGTALGVGFGKLIGLVTGVELGDLTKLLLTGATFGSVALLGFFAYLIFNWLGNGLFRKQSHFQVLQVILIFLVLGNLIYLNLSKFAGDAFWVHLVIPCLIVAVGWVVAFLKVKGTNHKTFIPTLFFMIAATILEATPSLNSKSGEVPLSHIFFTILILLSCNAWQILNLHRWTKRSIKEAKAQISATAEKQVNPTKKTKKKKNRKKGKKKNR
jgi:KinB signaling pathway activation protein